jgi:3-polyprenyl-4-hydroxybenzoate decarboxylase
MITLARLGVRIVPPFPPFYLRQQTSAEIVDVMARRALDSLGIADALADDQRWRGDEQ